MQDVSSSVIKWHTDWGQPKSHADKKETEKQTKNEHPCQAASAVFPSASKTHSGEKEDEVAD